MAFSAAGRRAAPEDLVALSERYGLDPAAAASVLGAASVPIDIAIEVLVIRCDHDLDSTFELASSTLGVGEDYVCAVLGVDAGSTIDPARGLRVVDETALVWDVESVNATTGVDL